MENNLTKLENLKIIREKNHITQTRLSIEMEVSQELISQYELGKSTPTPSMLVKLADFFNCSTDYLLGRTNISKPVSSIISYTTNTNNINIIDKYNNLSAENKKHFESYLDFLINYKK